MQNFKLKIMTLIFIAEYSTFAWKIPWTEKPGRLQSIGSLESDTTEQLHFHFSLSCTGEGNGNPLQCSCLENPRDGGAWWAAVYGIAQSRTRLKRLKRSDCFFLRKTLWETNWKHLSYRMFQSFTHPSIFLLFVYFFISLNNITEDLVLPEPSRIRRGKLWTNF